MYHELNCDSRSRNSILNQYRTCTWPKRCHHDAHRCLQTKRAYAICKHSVTNKSYFSRFRCFFAVYFFQTSRLAGLFPLVHHWRIRVWFMHSLSRLQWENISLDGGIYKIEFKLVQDILWALFLWHWDKRRLWNFLLLRHWDRCKHKEIFCYNHGTNVYFKIFLYWD